MKKKASPRELAGLMYRYFIGYDEQAGAPSFSKFARLSGLTLADLLAMRERAVFDRAYSECCEIRRDYLIDRALTKRFDPSLVKYLLEDESGTQTDSKDVAIRLEVCE